MIENFLRPPDSPAAVAADLLRALGFLSAVVAVFFFTPTDAGIIAFALPGLVAPRFIGMRPVPDMVLCAVVLVAAWSNVFELYTTISWWDVVVHVACTGVVAAGSYLFLARLDVVPVPFDRRFRPATGVVLTTAFGLALSALWEIVEWLGAKYITSDIFVTYEDTIGDMAAGGVGSLLAGLLVGYAPLLRPDPAAHPRDGAHAETAGPAAEFLHTSSRAEPEV